MKPKLPNPDILYDEDFQSPVDSYSAAKVQSLIDKAYAAGMRDALNQDGDLLTIAYLHGFAKGKDAALSPPEQPK